MKCILAAAALALASPAAADQVTRMFSHGRWTVDLILTDDAELWCKMWSSHDAAGTAMALWGGHGLDLTFSVNDDDWIGEYGDVTVNVDIDYEHFDGYGALDGNGQLNIPNLSPGFVDAIAAGRAIAVFDETGDRRLITYSLSGSYAATLAFLECWDQI